MGIGGPDEGLRIVVGFGEVSVDRSLEIDDAFEDATFEPLPGQLGEETFNGIEPGGRGRSEVEVEARMPLEPGAHFWMLMRGVVVDDQMQFPPCRLLAVDLVQEADELFPENPHSR